MVATKRQAIEQKRFTKTDLRALGTVLMAESGAIRAAGGRADLTFRLKCDDGTEHWSQDLSLFADGAKIDDKTPRSIQFWLHGDGFRWVELSLTHGGKHDDTLNVTGEEGEWVARVFTRLQERMSAVDPSESWLTRHPKVTYHLVALGFGTLIVIALNQIINLGVASGMIVLSGGFTPVGLEFNRVVLAQFPAVEFLAAWSVRWLLGGLPAWHVRKWILAAWPKLDLNFGPERRKRERMRRNRVLLFVILGVVPILVQLLRDIGKMFL